MTHWQKYARAYLIGAVFILVTVGTAISGEFANVTDTQVASMSHFRWFLAIVNIVVSVGTTLLAFFNRSAQGKQTDSDDKHTS